jgi:hypothetical protein
MADDGKILTSGEVMQGVATLGESGVLALRKEANEKSVDFYTHVAAHVLKCEPERVSNLARNEAKAALFMYQYGRRN